MYVVDQQSSNDSCEYSTYGAYFLEYHTFDYIVGVCSSHDKQ